MRNPGIITGPQLRSIERCMERAEELKWPARGEMYEHIVREWMGRLLKELRMLHGMADVKKKRMAERSERASDTQ